MEDTPIITPSNPKHTSHSGLIFFSLTLLVLASLIGLYISTSLLKAPPSPIETQESQTPVPEERLTYTDSELGFEFSYPADFVESGSIYGGPATENIPPLFTLTDPATVMDGTDSPFDGFAIYYTNSPRASLEAFVEAEKAAMIEIAKINGQDTSTLGKTEKITILGRDVYTLRNYLPQDLKYYYFALNKGYLIVVYSEASRGSFEDTFSTILSTLKFAKSNSVETWQTYSNSEFNFSLQHPTDWEVRQLGPAGPAVLSLGIAPKSLGEDVLGLIFAYVNETVEGSIFSEKETRLFQGSPTKLVSQVKTTFAGLEATELTFINTVADVQSKTYIFNKNNYVFKINGGGISESNPRNKIITQILSTLKFTN